MSVYLLCSLRGYKRPRYRDMILTDAMELVANDYGRVLDGIDWRKLDLVAGGVAFADITDIKAMHLGRVFRAREVIDLWWRIKERTYQPGRGYEEWVWQSVMAYIRVSGTGGRAWRLMMD